MKKFISLFVSALVCLSLNACDLSAQDVHDIVDIVMDEDEPEIQDDVVVEDEPVIEEENPVIEEDEVVEDEPVIEEEQPQYSDAHEFLQDLVYYYNYEDPDFDAYYEYFETDDYIWFEITDTKHSWDEYDAEGYADPQSALDAHDQLLNDCNNLILSEIRALGFNGPIDFTISANDGMKIFYFSASQGSSVIDYSDIYFSHGNNNDDSNISNTEYYLYPVANTCFWGTPYEEIGYIGTITWYDPMTGIYGAMGHHGEGISDNSQIYEGYVRGISYVTDDPDDVYQAITDIEVDENIVFGDMTYNGNYGIYGNYTNGGGWIDESYPVGWKNEIHPGAATLLSEAPNMSDDDIYGYTIEITDVYSDSFDFIITDQYMIDSGNGIAQGMSGSTIIQDGHIIGALSGLYCTESDEEFYGSAVYVEDMLYEAGILR